MDTILKKSRDVAASDVAGLVKRAWESSMTKSNILSGWRDSGLWPFNPDVVLSSGKLSVSISLSQKEGMPDIILPEFSKKHRPAVQAVIDAVDAGHVRLAGTNAVHSVLATADAISEMIDQTADAPASMEQVRNYAFSFFPVSPLLFIF